MSTYYSLSSSLSVSVHWALVLLGCLGTGTLGWHCLLSYWGQFREWTDAREYLSRLRGTTEPSSGTCLLQTDNGWSVTRISLLPAGSVTLRKWWLGAMILYFVPVLIVCCSRCLHQGGAHRTKTERWSLVAGRGFWDHLLPSDEPHSELCLAKLEERVLSSQERTYWWLALLWGLQSRHLE